MEDFNSVEPDALGADFLTVELDTPQPIEYVVKWAEVGSKFTLACVKKEADEGSGLISEAIKVEPDETFYAQYEEVYPDCEVTEQSVVVRADSDDDDDAMEPGSSQLHGHDDEEEEEDTSDSGSETGEYRESSGNYRCSYCGKCYSHSSSLSRHQQLHTGMPPAPPPPSSSKQTDSNPPAESKKYQCSQCGLRFKGSRTLGTHKKVHGGRRLYPCNICGKDFNHSSSLSRHRLIHKKGKGIPPGVPPELVMGLGRRSCGPKSSTAKSSAAKSAALKSSARKSSTAKSSASRKGKKGRAGWGEKFYACPQCDKTFKNSASLSRHQVSHVKDLLTTYTQSDDALAKPSDLKIRLKLCSRDKPNFYTLCKKNKRSKAAKRAALLSAADEEEEGQYACQQCDKHFSHTSSLARHQQMHKGENKFTCAYCKKTFTRLSNLHHHEKSHTTGKTYECAICNKTFVHSSSYSRHKRSHTDQEQAAKQRQRKRGGVVNESAPVESDSE